MNPLNALEIQTLITLVQLTIATITCCKNQDIELLNHLQTIEKKLKEET